MIEMVGTEPIPGLLYSHQAGKTERSMRDVQVFPSDHFGLYALFCKQ